MAINRDKVEAQAIKLLQAGKLDKAILEFKKLLDDDPADVRTLLKLGETYVKMGAKKESIESYEKAASIYTEQGFYLKAVAVYKQILRVDATIPALHLKLAELYQQLSLTSDAIQHYQQVAVFYEQQGKAKESLDILKRMVDLDPDNLASRIKLGELFAQQGLAEDAVKELRRALEFLKTQQRFDDFVRVGEKLVVYDPNAIDVARELAQIYMQRGQSNVALSKLQLCFKADPRNVEVLALIAQAFLDMQQVPKTVSVYKEMAKIYAADGNVALSRRTWERVLELTPGDEEAEQALGGGETAPARPTLAPTVVAPAMANAPMVAPHSMPTNVAASSARAQEDEQLTRLLTETDVYVKYGLKDKAIEHLQKVFAVRADYLPAIEKLKALQQQQGGSAYVETLRKLAVVSAAQKHPRAAEWADELREAETMSSRPQTAPPPSLAGRSQSQPSTEGEFVAIDDNAAGLPDEPILEDSSMSIPVDEAGLLNIEDEPLLPHNTLDALPPDEAEPATLALSVPRMPTGVMQAPAVAARGAPPAPPLELSDEAEESEQLVRNALQNVSDDMMDEVMSSEFILEPSSEFQLAEPKPAALEEEGELKTGPGFSPLAMAINTVTSPEGEPKASSVDEDELDRMAREALFVPEANTAPLPQRGSSSGQNLVPTAVNPLSPDELDEIAEFEGGTDEPSSGPVSRAPSRPPSVPRMPLPPEFGEDGDGFDDPTLAAMPGQNNNASSDVPTDERPRKPAQKPPVTQPSQPLVSSSSSGGGDTMFVPALAGLQAKQPSGSLASKPSEASAAPAPEMSADALHPSFDAEVSEEFDPSKFDLPPEVKELLRKPSSQPPSSMVDTTPVSPQQQVGTQQQVSALPKAPPPQPALAALSNDFDSASGDITLRGGQPKLQFADKQQGFENDPANQFFPDELEECEFLIQQEILDEAKEQLTAILEDVPDSARVQWMLARIDAKENGQPEPPAPWEQRILEEVQAQLETLGIAEEAEKMIEQVQEETQQVSVEEVLSQFKQKVAEIIPEEDAATHYDLGIAYREMGLLDDAVNEFQIAARAPAKSADAKFLIGKTRMDQGRLDEALAAFGEALAVPQAARGQRGAAEYERGVCLELLGRGTDALRALKAAKAHGHDAIDLDRRIKALIDKHGDVPAGASQEGNGLNGHGANGAGHTKNERPQARSKNIDYL